ncbi:hypothetical protein [Streptomyces sp. NPDC058240]|uniref:hypothetical protein n=1 Tax=Streptomyces sp. NPDC058240 TaxID=3346396 RepID=UPI0036E9739C
MPRPKDADFTSTLTMLHTAVMTTGADLRDALGKGVEKLEASGQAAQQSTTKTVVDELGRMRVNLREARDRLSVGGEVLNSEVRQAVAELRNEMREVRKAVEDLTPLGPAPLPTDSGTGPEPELPYAPAAHEVPPAQTPQPLSATTSSAPASAAGHSAAPQTALQAVVPVQRDGGDGNRDKDGDGDGDSRDTVPLPVEQVQQAVRDVLAEELAPLGSLLENWVTERDTALIAVRDDVRAQLHGLATELREQLVAARKESRAGLVALREEANGLRAGLEKLQSAADVGEPAVVEVGEEHSELLRRAARVSSAMLLCHRDMWEFITAHAGRHPHFRVPPQVIDQGHDRIRAALSGRSLIALLISLHSVEHASSDGDGDRELAATLYERLRNSLSGLTAAGQPVAIALDDRASSEDDTMTGAVPLPAPIGNPDSASHPNDQEVGNEVEKGVGRQVGPDHVAVGEQPDLDKE